MFQTQTLTFDDFSGGITDNYIDAPLNQYYEANNFVVGEDSRKLLPLDGATVYDADKPQLPLGITRVGALIYFNDILFTIANKKLYFEDGINWSLLQGPSSNDAFTSGDENSVISRAEWNGHLFLTNDEYSPTIKTYEDDAGDIQLRSAGLPALASDPVVAGTAGVNDYIYAFVYYYEYNVKTVTFQDFGPTTRVQELQINTPDVSTVAITGIPVLSNGVTYNWDTANIKIKIYRTTSGGETLYYLGEVTNGTTTYNDTTADSGLSTEILYTDGGVLDNDEPPLAKTIHIANGSCWYGNIKSGTEIIANRVYQSIVDDPDSVPATAFVDLEDEIIAISSYLDRVIVLCRNSIYRLDGSYDEIGGGIVTYQKISDTFGCVAANSVVQTPNGVVFASDEGFAFTDGFGSQKISGNFNTRYKEIVASEIQRKRIYGALDKVEGRVWFAVQKGTGGTDDIDSCYILHLRFPITKNSVFTTAGDMDSFSPTSIVFKDGELIRGDRRGYILKHVGGLTSLPTIDTTKVAADWYTEAIMYTFTSVASSFGDYKYRKFTPRCIVRAENISNLALQMTSINDLGTRERLLPIVRWRGNFIWGDPLFTWGDEDFTWGNSGLIEDMRRFHGEDMRCSYRQLKLSNAFAIILESDNMATVEVDPVLKTATLEDAEVEWPDDLGGYSIYFEYDGYQKEFSILSSTSDTLTLNDPDTLLLNGAGQKWIIKGYPKDEVLKLLSLSIDYALLGQTQRDYNPSGLGGNE